MATIRLVLRKAAAHVPPSVHHTAHGVVLQPGYTRQYKPAAKTPVVSDQVYRLTLSEVRPDPNQHRKAFPEREMRELADSIKQTGGNTTPIVVRRIDDGGKVKYQIIAGERRFRASKLAGMKDIRAIVRENVSDEDALAEQVIENLNRLNVTPTEEASAYRQLADGEMKRARRRKQYAGVDWNTPEGKLRLEGIGRAYAASKTGNDKARVNYYIVLADLPEEVRKMVDKGSLTTAHAHALLRLTDPADDARLYHDAKLKREREVHLVRMARHARANSKITAQILQGMVTEYIRESQQIKMFDAAEAAGGETQIQRQEQKNQVDRVVAVVAQAVAQLWSDKDQEFKVGALTNTDLQDTVRQLDGAMASFQSIREVVQREMMGREVKEATKRRAVRNIETGGPGVGRGGPRSLFKALRRPVLILRKSWWGESERHRQAALKHGFRIEDKGHLLSEAGAVNVEHVLASLPASAAAGVKVNIVDSFSNPGIAAQYNVPTDTIRVIASRASTSDVFADIAHEIGHRAERLLKKSDHAAWEDAHRKVHEMLEPEFLNTGDAALDRVILHCRMLFAQQVFTGATYQAAVEFARSELLAYLYELMADTVVNGIHHHAAVEAAVGGMWNAKLSKSLRSVQGTGRPVGDGGSPGVASRRSCGRGISADRWGDVPGGVLETVRTAREGSQGRLILKKSAVAGYQRTPVLILRKSNVAAKTQVRGGKVVRVRGYTDKRTRKAPAFTGKQVTPKGNVIYQYTPEQRAAAAYGKFIRVAGLANKLPELVARVDSELGKPDTPKAKVIAAAVALMDRLHLRVGTEKYAEENGTYGVTTLKPEHVTVEGDEVRFQFTGKKHVEWDKALTDGRLAKFIRSLRKNAPDDQLFWYHDASGQQRSLRAAQVNAWLGEYGGTAKDLRTLHATRLAYEALKKASRKPSEEPLSAREVKQRVRAVVKGVATELGHTPAVCRANYILPAIIDEYVENGGRLITRNAWKAAKA